ncbi:hypothetical protein ACWEKJ_30685 [Amycolatopsis thermoflava]
MTGRGRPAAQPAAGWRPAPRRSDDGLVRFVSEDGRQQRTFDTTTLPGSAGVREDLVAAFEAATGPLGTWKRQASANGLWTVVRKASRWLADNRPSLTGLADLSGADTRMMLLSMRQPNGDLPVGLARALFGYCPVVSDDVRGELARHASRNRQAPRQPYTAQELRWITIAARTIVRRAKNRLTTGEALTDPNGDGDGDGRARFLTTGEAWSFAVLLAALTGLNSSVLYGLPACHTQAGSPDEPGVALVDAVKHRRGPRSAMTLPLTALPSPLPSEMPPALRPAESDRRPTAVLNTSLTTAFGVFTLLVRLTEPARRQVGTDRAFVYDTGRDDAAGRSRPLVDTAVRTSPEARRRWLAEVLTGDADRDEVLLGVSLDRLRKTYLEQHRRPVAHTPATLAGYLRKMRPVTEDGFHIVREALDEQVQAALARRQMTVDAHPDEPDDNTERDTILASCKDFQHSPLDGGNPCRQTFLSCLDCANARAFPRHLPFQLAVLDELKARQTTVVVQQWITDLAGRVAQLGQIVGEFEPAQREQARRQITNTHRHLARRLFTGDLDPL